jgi:hypothetical protein
MDPAVIPDYYTVALRTLLYGAVSYSMAAAADSSATYGSATVALGNLMIVIIELGPQPGNAYHCKGQGSRVKVLNKYSVMKSGRT